MFCLQQPFRNSQDTSPHLAVASVLETELEMVKDLDLVTGLESVMVTEKESERPSDLEQELATETEPPLVPE